MHSTSGPTKQISACTLERLNALTFSAPQFRGALEVLARLPDRARSDPRAQALALQAYAADAFANDDPVLSAALHARIVALDRWTVSYNPDRSSDAAAVMEAAGRFRLSACADGIGFEPTGFQELIFFIDDLPW